jgi:hypothetical protein
MKNTQTTDNKNTNILKSESIGRNKFRTLAKKWNLTEDDYFFPKEQSCPFDVLYKKDEYWHIGEIKNLNNRSTELTTTARENKVDGHLLKRDKWTFLMDIFYNMSLIEIMTKYVPEAIEFITEDDYTDCAFPMYINFFSDDVCLWWHMDFDIKVSWNNIRKCAHHRVNSKDIFGNFLVEETNGSNIWVYCSFFTNGLKEVPGQKTTIDR